MACRLNLNAVVQNSSMRVLIGVLMLSGCATATGRSAHLTAAEHEAAAAPDAGAGRQAVAAEHLAAAQALREAEASACAGLTAAERTSSPLSRGIVTRVVPLYPTQFRNPGNVPDRKLMGATIAVRAERGMTAEWLQRLVNCHIAESRVGVSAESDIQDCPLAVPGISAVVRSTGAGFVVDIAANDATGGAAEEILRRASRLVSP